LSDTVLHSIVNLAAIGLARARAQEATARAEAAEQSSELRATVLDAIAHEFKTPLTSMKAAASDLLAGAPPAGREHELLAIIDEDLDRFQALVTDAVRMLRIDAGDFAVNPERRHLAEIVDDTVKQFERRLDGRRLTTRVPSGIVLEADPELLALALRQLLDNALKYSSDAASIEIQAKSDGAVDIEVTNSGSMIPERERARIFERFYRGPGASRMPGTGMGLAIVRQIVRAHGGTVAVTSSPEKGTTFTLTFPQTVAASA